MFEPLRLRAAHRFSSWAQMVEECPHVEQSPIPKANKLVMLLVLSALFQVKLPQPEPGCAACHPSAGVQDTGIRLQNLAGSSARGTHDGAGIIALR